MGGDKTWTEYAVGDSLAEDSTEEIEHEAPSVEALEPSMDEDAPSTEEGEFEIVQGSRVYPGIVRRGSPGRHIIDTDGTRRRMVD